MEIDFATPHVLNHLRFAIRLELYVVQDKVHGSPEPNVVQGTRQDEML